ncbi:MAG: hypothetical protein KF764_30955 [Labilithrix sp.]|nr:hypothetical protein [Labilithrix sp.]
MVPPKAWVVTLLGALAVGACSSSNDAGGGDGASSGGPSGGGSSSGDPSSSGGAPPLPTSPEDGPKAGNPDGTCAVPADAQPEDISNPRTVVGTGTPESCTGDAFVAAVEAGGVITFNCGPAPAKITLTKTAKIRNDKGPKIVIDGGGKITLDGGGKVRILYQNACDQAQVWTTGDCNNQPDPVLSLQNLTFVGGNAKGLETGDNEGGGGAVYVRGGRLKIINSRFFGNVCDDLGSDVGGGAVRVLQHLNGGSVSRPTYIVNSTFGGKAGYGNTCANGGAISSIGVSYTVINSLLSDNKAIGHGANDGEGGNGGAIYNDGNTFNLEVCGSVIEDNKANEGGSAIFYVSNDRSGMLFIKDSKLRRNPRGTFETADFPGLFVLAKSPPQVENSTIER